MPCIRFSMYRVLIKRFSPSVAAWVLASAIITLIFPLGASAQEEPEEPGLPAKLGFHYPGGYDLNTVKVLDVEVRNFELPQHGPVMFDVTSGGLGYRIVAGPHWFWSEKGLTYTPGNRIRVKGSIVQGRDSGLYILAAELIDPEGKRPSLKLRDENGYPLWPGRHRMGPPPMHGPPPMTGPGRPGGPR